MISGDPENGERGEERPQRRWIFGRIIPKTIDNLPRQYSPRRSCRVGVVNTSLVGLLHILADTRCS